MMSGVARQATAILGAYMLTSGFTSAQDEDLENLSLQALMDVQVVSATRRAQRHGDSLRNVVVVTSDRLMRGNYRNIPQALMEIAGVHMQETNTGGGSPILQGMVGNRILLMVDGIRINNASYRYGPVQYLNMIDIQQVERIEILFGPGSVLYGSDALGGVVHVFTKPCPSSETGRRFSSRVFARYSSADMGLMGRYEFNGSQGRFGFRGGVSGKRFNDLYGGGAVGRQRHTGYDETGGDLKVSFRISPRSSIQVGFARLTQYDVLRSDLLRLGADLDYRWTPQRRDSAYAVYRIDRPTRKIDYVEIGINYQGQLERIDRIAAALPAVVQNQLENAATAGAQVQMGSQWGERQQLTYGLDFYGDWITSQRTDRNLVSGVEVPKRGTLGDGTNFQSVALYLQDEIGITPRLALILGARLTLHHAGIVFAEGGQGGLDVSHKPKALTGSAYGSYLLAREWKLFGGVAQGFRAPNANDLTVLGSNSGRFDVPNPHLSPESSVTTEAGVRRQGPGWLVTASTYVSRYRGLMERTPGTYLGLNFFDANDNGVRDNGEMDVYQRTNMGRVLTRGFAAGASVEMARSWTLYGDFTYSWGEDRISLTPYTRIPPLKCVSGLRWQAARRLWVESYLIGAGAQHRVSPADSSDHRIGPAGTPGFLIANVRMGLDWQGVGLFTAGLENLANKAYKWHGSGVYAPGANLVFGLGRSF